MNHLELIQSKIYDLPALLRQILIWRFLGDKIIFTNGCFDLLHYGHVCYLSKAADLGKQLIVGINSDASVKKLNKGPNRPIQDENTRATIMASLHFVSAVIIFREDTPYDLIKAIEPDILVKGGDWKPENTVGYDIVKTTGGEVVIFEYVDGFSTSGLEKKIKS